MVNETISVRLGTAHPEDNPALAGAFPPPPGFRPLVDDAGRPLLPRLVPALRKAIARSTPAHAAAQRTRSALDAGAAYPAIDPFLLSEYQQRGRRLQAIATGELLGHGLLALRRGIAAGLAGLGRLLTFAPAAHSATTDLERPQGLARPGALDVAPDYEQRRARFYGRGL